MIKEREERKKYALANPKKTYAELAPIFGLKNGEVVRNFFRRNNLPNKKHNVQSKRADIDLADQVAKYIKTQKRSLRGIADFFDVSPNKVILAIEELERRNIIIIHGSNLRSSLDY